MKTEYDFSSTGKLDKMPFYFYINPAKDRNYQLLQELAYHKFHLRDLPSRMKDKFGELTKFPQFTKVNQKIIIEFLDCVIQGLDLLDF